MSDIPKNTFKSNYSRTTTPGASRILSLRQMEPKRTIDGEKVVPKKWIQRLATNQFTSSSSGSFDIPILFSRAHVTTRPFKPAFHERLPLSNAPRSKCVVWCPSPSKLPPSPSPDGASTQTEFLQARETVSPLPQHILQHTSVHVLCERMNQ